jgi:predicted O-methyltransferase YrrM
MSQIPSSSPPASPVISVHDYVSPNLQQVRPDQAFPNMVVGDKAACPWPWFRGHVPHVWYVDRRAPRIGFVSRDEAAILYNIALSFRGRRALEIGCWLGWSACHLALGGVTLDIIDPVLLREDFRQSVVHSLTAANVIGLCKLYGGYSPAAVNELEKTGNTYSLIFIDGNHDGDAPLLDARACLPLAEEDAMVVFHDLNAPAVGVGLEFYREQGWQTRVYQTMQIMGVAWRGNVTPPAHHPDPAVDWELPAHLRHHPVSR